MANPVVHFEIVGPKGQELQRFYGDLFDWQIDANNPMNYGMVNTGSDQGIPGGIGPADGPNRVTIYVQVDNLQATLDRAEQLGGKTLMSPAEVPGAGVTLALFADPEGNVTGLIKG